MKYLLCSSFMMALAFVTGCTDQSAETKSIPSMDGSSRSRSLESGDFKGARGEVTIIKTDVKSADLPYEVRYLMVKSGAQNVPLPELEKREKDGTPLSDDEKSTLEKLKKAQVNKSQRSH